MKRKQMIGAVELELLNVVWEKGEATVQEVVDVIHERRNTAYTSVLTMLRNLSQKGYLKHRVEGRAFIYSAAIRPEQIRSDLLRDTVDKVFRGSKVELVQNLLANEDLSDSEIEKIKKLIEDLT